MRCTRVSPLLAAASIVLGTAAWLAGCTTTAPATSREYAHNPPTPKPVGILSPHDWSGCMGGDPAQVHVDSEEDGSVLTTTFGSVSGMRWSVKTRLAQRSLRLIGWRGTNTGAALQLVGGGKAIWYAVPTPPPPPTPPPLFPRTLATTDLGRESELMGWGLPTEYHHRTPWSVLRAPTAQLPDRTVRSMLPTKWELALHFGFLRWRVIGSAEYATGNDYRLDIYPDEDTIEYTSVRHLDAYTGSLDDAKRLALAQIARFGGLPGDAKLTYEVATSEIAMPLARQSSSARVRPTLTGYYLTWGHSGGLADDQIQATVWDSDGTPFVSFVSWRWHELGDAVARKGAPRLPLSPLDAYAVSSCYGWKPIAADDRVDPFLSIGTSYWSGPGAGVARPVYEFRYSRSGLARLVDVYSGGTVAWARLRPDPGDYWSKIHALENRDPRKIS